MTLDSLIKVAITQAVFLYGGSLELTHYIQNFFVSLDFYSMYLADSKVYLLNHLKALQQAARLTLAAVNLNVKNFHVTIESEHSKQILYPQFLEILDTGPVYLEDFTNNVVCFTGWRPYRASLVNAFSDKPKLQQMLTKQQFLTPANSILGDCRNHPVIVKNRGGSFGKGMHGPYKNLNDYALNAEDGEYFEEFIKGEILKINYWDAVPVSVEVQDMPIFTGDGTTNILDMATARAKQRGRDSIDELSLYEIMSYQDKTLDSILAAEETVLADFRYESDFLERYAVKEIVIPSKIFEVHDAALLKLGQLLFGLAQQEDMTHLYYSVDAILTKNNQLYILEANANPTVHQSAYSVMLKTLMGK